MLVPCWLRLLAGWLNLHLAAHHLLERLEELLRQFLRGAGDQAPAKLRQLAAGLGLCRVAQDRLLPVRNQLDIGGALGKAGDTAITLA